MDLILATLYSQEQPLEGSFYASVKQKQRLRIIVYADQSTSILSPRHIWAVSGCDEYQADVGSTGAIGPLSPGVRITNPCKFEYISDTSLGGSIYFTYNQDETYLVEQTAD